MQIEYLKMKTSNLEIKNIYRTVNPETCYKYVSEFISFNVTKLCRTNSGITQITVMSSPYPNGKEISCEHNCYYCPNEPAHGYTKIAVISGVGVRKYYEKFGYKFNNNYMIKNLYN